MLAAEDKVVRDGSHVAFILTAMKDLLFAASYIHRNSMKYASRLHANLVLARRDTYLQQSLFNERFNNLRTRNDLGLLLFDGLILFIATEADKVGEFCLHPPPSS